MLAEHYAGIKLAHIGFVFASGGLFMLRGLLVLGEVGASWHAAARRLSYLIDTALLATALSLLWILGLDPLTTPWLAAKLSVLAAYIVLGSLALKRARTPAGRALAFGAALLCFATIVSIAHRHDPWGFLAGLVR